MRIALFLLMLIVSCSHALSQYSLVNWSYEIGSEIDYGIITKTNTTNLYGNAGAIALNLLLSSDDGMAEFPITALSKQYCLGLIPANTEMNFDIREFEYALEITTSNTVRLLNYGLLLGTFGVVKLGDKYGFMVVNGKFYLSQNGRIISNGYTLQSTNHLLAISLKTAGAQVEALKCDFMNLFTAEWESWVGLDVLNSGQLIKSASGNSWGSSAAYSSNQLDSFQDGTVFFSYDLNSGEQAFGLIADSTGAGYLDIDYCAKIGSNRVDFYNRGQYIGNCQPLRAGDIIEVARVGEKMRYLVNSTIIVELSVDDAEILKIQGSLKTNITEAGPYQSSLTSLSKESISYIRLYNADDPEHIPFTRVESSSIYAYFIYKELYVESGNLNLQVIRDDNTDVTSSVLTYPTAIQFGENMIRVNIVQLQGQRQYYLVVRDGQDRKWEMNFYKN